MIKRFFKFSNFRTLGINEEEELELTTVDDLTNNVGGLVIVIGLNNSGKSNIIEGIKQFNVGKISQTNAPKFLYEPNIEPMVKYIVKAEDETYEVKVKGDKHFINYSSNKKIEEKPISAQHKEMMQRIINDKENIHNLLGNSQYQNIYGIVSNTINALVNCNSQDELFSLNGQLNTIVSTLDQNRYFRQQIQYNHELKQLYDNFVEMRNSIQNNHNQNAFITKQFEDQYGFSLKPNIFIYNDKITFSTYDMCSNIGSGKLDNPNFFSKLFSMLENIKLENLEICYKKFIQFGSTNKGLLKDFENLINTELQKLSKKFNAIYQVNNAQYDFSISLETNRIDFIIRDSNQSVYLDDQSSGFKWFFNFFFNMISDQSLAKGSIILMDEPATNLHVIGQIELRKLMKDLAINNQWTFVTSTHSPFLIDVDNLDELRVVEKRNYITHINNKFTLIDESNADVLYPIRSALTVRKDILVNRDNTVIFVEGVTDYNYLVAFKKLLKINNLTVLPIQGIKKENLLQQLLKVTKDPILLVDSDQAGNDIYHFLKDQKTIEVIQLREIDEQFKEIEDLFIEQDREKLTFIDDKRYYSSVNFKNNIEKYKELLNEKTINNFKKLIDRIMS